MTRNHVSLERMKIMEQFKHNASDAEGYEISIRREDIATDLCNFYYGDDRMKDEEESNAELTAQEQGTLLKCVLGLFAAAVGTVLMVLLV